MCGNVTGTFHVMEAVVFATAAAADLVDDIILNEGYDRTYTFLSRAKS